MTKIRISRINSLNKNKSTQGTVPHGEKKTEVRYNKFKKEMLLFSTGYFGLKNKRRTGAKTKEKSTFVRIVTI